MIFLGSKMHLKYEVLDEKVTSRLDEIFSVKDALIKVNPGGVLVPPKYKELGDNIWELNVRPDDVWAVAYPRTGLFYSFVLY